MALKVWIPNLPYPLLTIFPRAACGPAGALVCRAPVTHTCSAALGPAECQNTAGEGKSALAELEHSGTGVWCLEYVGFPARERERERATLIFFSAIVAWQELLQEAGGNVIVAVTSISMFCQPRMSGAIWLNISSGTEML